MRLHWLILGALVATAFAAVPSHAAAQDALQTLSLEKAQRQCIDFTTVKQGAGPRDYRECRVSESGEFGVVAGETYYYAIYCLMPAETTDNGRCEGNSFSARNHRKRGLAVFAGPSSAGSVRLMFERADPDFGTIYFLKPEIIRTAAGLVLYLPTAIDGTSAGNDSEYYLRVADRWERIDALSWHADLLKRLGTGLMIWKGIWPDLRTMRAETGLYREGDANCCPTGGVARMRLGIRDRRFVLESVEIERSLP